MDFLSHQEMTMIKRWSKPKSFSGGDTPQPLDDPVDLISKCTILDADVSLLCFAGVFLPTVNQLNPVLNMHVCAKFPDGSEPGAGAEAEEWNESGSSTETETHGTELFWLDYQADSGTITSFLVHKVSADPIDWYLWSILLCYGLNSLVFSLSLKEDRPEKVVERVAEKNILDLAMRAALEARIRKEIDKRRDKRWMIFSNSRLWWQRCCRQRGAILHLQLCTPTKHQHCCWQSWGQNKDSGIMYSDCQRDDPQSIHLLLR